MWPVWLFSSLCLLVALWALAVSLHTWRHAPGRRLWMELQGRIEDLEHDQDQLHTRLHTRARQSNIEKATSVRVEKQTDDKKLLQEAQAALQHKGQPPGPAPLPMNDDPANLVRWRQRAGLH